MSDLGHLLENLRKLTPEQKALIITVLEAANSMKGAANNE